VGFGEVIITEEKLRELDWHGWELYHVAEDFTETKNLAETRRDKLIELIALWYIEAGKYKVLPIDSRGTARLAEERPSLSQGRGHYVLYPGTATIPDYAAPNVLNRKHTITASVSIGDDAEGVILAHGGSSGGYSLYVKDSTLHYAYNYLGVQRFHVSTAALPLGRRELRFQFTPTDAPDTRHGHGAAGHAELYVDGELAGEGDLPVTIPLRMGITEGMTCGRDEGSPVTADYEAPFPFTGELEQVVLDVFGARTHDMQAEMRVVMAHQ
jgi:arylsulfatase